MPIYEYRCNKCGAISEFLVGIGSKSKSLSCKQCGSPQLEKMISVSHPLKSEKRDTWAHLLRKRGTMFHSPLLHRKWMQTGLNSCKEFNLSFSSLSETGW